MSNVIQIVQKLAPGGLEMLTVSLASKLSKIETIISLEGVEKELVSGWPLLKNLKTKIVALNKGEGLSFKLIKNLMSVFGLEKPDAIITHHIGPLLYAGLAARLCGVKKIIHVEHDAWHLQSKKRLTIAKLANFLIRPNIVAVSTQVAQDLNDLGFNNVKIIRNGIDTKRFSPLDQNESREKYNLPLNVPLYGASGRLEHVKGHDLLLQAFARLPNRSHLVIAGDGSQHDVLVELAIKLNISNRVHFLGLISDLPAFYSALDVFVQPSRFEGLPLAILEAQACDVKTAAFNVGGLDEGVCPFTGELVEADDIYALSGAMEHLYEGRNAKSPREFILENFNIRETIKGYRVILGDKK